MVKKVLVILLVIFVVIGAIFGASLFVKEKQESAKFNLIKEAGSIHYKKLAEDTYIELNESEIDLESGYFIKTDENSFARIFLPDNSMISLDEKTEIELQFNGNSVDINQLIGKSWNRVQTVTNGGSYTVNTPNTIAAVRGTIFGVGVDNDDHSRVFVEESKVDISKYDKEENGEKNVLESDSLSEEDIAEIIREAGSFRIIKSKLSKEFKETLWYLRNKIIDEEFKKLRGTFITRFNFRNLLKQRLEQRQDYVNLRLGIVTNNEIIQIDEIKKQLQSVDDITKINDQTCTNFTTAEFDDAINKVNAYQEYLNNAREISSLLSTMSESCSDSTISPDEAKNLEGIVNSINGTTR